MENHKIGDINPIVADSSPMVRHAFKADFYDHGFRCSRDTPGMQGRGMCDAVEPG